MSGGGGWNFLPLLFFVPVQSIKPANQLGNASSNRPWIIKHIPSTKNIVGG